MKSSSLRQVYPLCDICNAMVSTFDLREVLNSIAKTTVEALDVKASSIRLLDRQGRRLEMAAAYGLSEDYLNKGPVEVEQSRIDQAALAGQVVTILDATSDERFQYPEEARREGIYSVLCVPLRIAERAIGVIRAYSTLPRPFSEEDLKVLYTLACHGAIAIEAARLRDQLKRQYDDLMNDIWTWYGEIQSAWRP